jgi:pyridoxamine-phosphate oxidase
VFSFHLLRGSCIAWFKKNKMEDTKKIISGLREDFSGAALDEKTVEADPLKQFNTWMKEALEKKVSDPNSMIVATASSTGIPSARVMLLRDYSEKGFTFFTNYNSKKGREIDENPHASLLFFWPALMRQIRIYGLIEKVSPVVSSAYFKERPKASQVSAWVSPQSHPVKNRQDLDEHFSEFEEKYKDKEVPCPVFWGGYILKPESYEFWQGQAARLHDRIQYTLDKENNVWKIERLGA